MNIRGQSLLELTLMLPLFLAFWIAIVWSGRVFILSIELMNTARHGVFWLAYHDASNMKRAQETQLVRSECTAFLHRQAPSLDISKVNIVAEPGDLWHPLGPKNLLNVKKLIKLAKGLEKILKDEAGLIQFKPASVKVTYNLDTPPLLRAIPGFPQTIPLRGYCVCYR